MKTLRQYLKLALLVISIVLINAPAAFAQAEAYSGVISSMELFQENCAVCHGENLEGAAQGTPLGGAFRHGDSMPDVIASISNGYEASGMPDWQDTFSPEQIRSIAMYILETRANLDYVTSNFDMPLAIPDGWFE
ncbi:MAG TPA: cytochrome c, partial [Acidobacteria bacterium]|nr:cytochrome c [Acidobacteriota bacterium]